jgi:hypothetical protein
MALGRPLWVKSGHDMSHEGASALHLKADIGINVR